MDELAAADVDPHVAEAVEEHEVTRLELVARDVGADRAVLHRPRCAEARSRPARRRTSRSPSSRTPTGSRRPTRTASRGTASRSRRRRRTSPEAPTPPAALPSSRPRGSRSRGPEEKSSVCGTRRRAGRRRSLEPRARLPLQLCLPARLRGLHARDLVLDRRRRAAAARRADPRSSASGRALGDHLGLPHAVGAELHATALRTSLRNRRDVLQHLRVLPADALGHVEPVEQVVEALRAEDHLDRAAGVAVDVEGAQPLRDVSLCGDEARARDHEMPTVGLQVGVDLARARCSRGCTTRSRARAASRAPGSARERPAPAGASRRSTGRPSPARSR